MFAEYIQQQLEQRQKAGLFRRRQVVEQSGVKLLVNDKKLTNFAGNDYLGLANESQTVSESLSGASASPLVTGYHKLHQELEQVMLDWVEAPSTHECLLFSSGFAANSGVISALFNHKNADARLIQDKLNHASLVDAGKHVQAMGHCRQYRFGHNDVNLLTNLMQDKTSITANNLLVTEGVFSMDGDSPDLSKMLTVANDYNAWFMLDDAHGIGVNGERGEGSFAKQQQHLNSTHILVITFGKAIGAQGAAVIADKSVIDYLTNFSKEYIYSTHISPVQTQLVLSNITKVQQQQWRRIQLHHNIEYFKSLMAALPFTLLPSDSAIQPILVHDEILCMTMAEALKQQGFWLGAMRYPTVAKGQARLRLTISASHTEDDIKGLVQALALIGEQYVREA